MKRRNVFITIILLAFFSLFISTSGAFAEDVDKNTEKKMKTVAVVVNFFPEIEPYLKKMGKDVKVTRYNNIDFYQFQEGGKNVILFIGGADQAAAAAGMQLALDKFDIDYIIIGGVCGGISPAVNVGDVVIPVKWANHTFGYIASPDRNFAPFFKPDKDFPVPYGDIFHDKKEILLDKDQKDKETRLMWFPVDPVMLEAAKKCVDVKLKKTKGPEPRVMITGNGVSGSWFVDNYSYRMHLLKYFKASIVDVESQAIAQTALTNGKPFIVIRGVSDYAGTSDGSRNTVHDYFLATSENSRRVVWKLIRMLP